MTRVSPASLCKMGDANTQVAELDARLSAALAAWQSSAGDVQPHVSVAERTASEGRALLAAVVATDMALTEQQRSLEVVDRAAGAALERVKRARDRVARCQARARAHRVHNVVCLRADYSLILRSDTKTQVTCYHVLSVTCRAAVHEGRGEADQHGGAAPGGRHARGGRRRSTGGRVPEAGAAAHP